MSAAEMKLDIFRKIDGLPKEELDRVYNGLLELINSTSRYELPEVERLAVAEALEESEKGNVYSHDSVIGEARHKYPNLKFK